METEPFSEVIFVWLQPSYLLICFNKLKAWCCQEEKGVSKGYFLGTFYSSSFWDYSLDLAWVSNKAFCLLPVRWHTGREWGRAVHSHRRVYQLSVYPSWLFRFKVHFLSSRCPAARSTASQCVSSEPVHCLSVASPPCKSRVWPHNLQVVLKLTELNITDVTKSWMSCQKNCLCVAFCDFKIIDFSIKAS